MGEEIHWDAAAIAYIRSRGDRYPDGLGIEPQWTQEVMGDVDLLALEPDPKSRMGAARFIGHSRSAGRVLVVIAYRDLDGEGTASTPGPPPERTSSSTSKETTMAKLIDPALAERLRRESEQTKDDPYPAGTTGRRPNRQKVYSVRLSAEEEAEVRRVAAAKHLPASTLVRSWILERLDQERSA